jgi:hypothetical protein
MFPHHLQDHLITSLQLSASGPIMAGSIIGYQIDQMPHVILSTWNASALGRRLEYCATPELMISIKIQGTRLKLVRARHWQISLTLVLMRCMPHMKLYLESAHFGLWSTKGKEHSSCSCLICSISMPRLPPTPASTCTHLLCCPKAIEQQTGAIHGQQVATI